MKYKSLPKILIIVILLYSCKTKPGASFFNGLKFVHQALESSNNLIIRENFRICRMIESDVTNPFTSSQASRVKPKMDLIVKRSDMMFEHLYAIKKNFTYNAFTSLDSLSEKSVTDEMKKNTSHFKDLYKDLTSLKSDFFKIDSNAGNQFRDMEIIPDFVNGKKINEASFYDFFFRDKSFIEMQVNLSQIENRVLLLKNATLTFLSFSYSNSAFIFDDLYNVLINQTKDQVKPTGEFSISAGIGSFSTSVNPKIQIAGKYLSMDSNTGLVTMKITAPSTPGNYNVPVVVEYINSDSNKVTRSFVVKYSVVE